MVRHLEYVNVFQQSCRKQLCLSVSFSIAGEQNPDVAIAQQQDQTDQES